MSSSDELVSVVELAGVPQSSVGSPCPMILSSENSLHLAFVLEEPTDDSYRSPLEISEYTSGRNCGVVKFQNPLAHLFGPPGDETLCSHPLADRGLQPYAAFEVLNSPWIRGLERMNSVHPGHQPDFFAAFRHFIFVFHDTTFECVAKGYEIAVHKGSVASVLRNSWYGDGVA